MTVHGILCSTPNATSSGLPTWTGRGTELNWTVWTLNELNWKNTRAPIERNERTFQTEPELKTNWSQTVANFQLKCLEVDELFQPYGDVIIDLASLTWTAESQTRKRHRAAFEESRGSTLPDILCGKIPPPQISKSLATTGVWICFHQIGKDAKGDPSR